MISSLDMFHDLIHCSLLLFLSLDAKDWTQGLAHARQTSYHSATTPTLNVALGVTPWILFCTPRLSRQSGRWAPTDFLLVLMRCELCSRLCLPPVFSLRTVRPSVRPYGNNWERALLSGTAEMGKWSSVTRISRGISLGLLFLVIPVRKFKENMGHGAWEMGRVCCSLRAESGQWPKEAIVPTYSFNQCHVIFKSL